MNKQWAWLTAQLTLSFAWTDMQRLATFVFLLFSLSWLIDIVHARLLQKTGLPYGTLKFKDVLHKAQPPHHIVLKSLSMGVS